MAKAAVKKQKNTDPLHVNQGRHEAQCSICKHAQREEIEQQFLTWKSPDKIAETFGVCRDSIYRHARAFDLLEPRRRNVRFALERIIERAGDVEVNANAVVSAVAAYSKLNANGQWIDRRETIDLNELFARMTEDEMHCDQPKIPICNLDITHQPIPLLPSTLRPGPDLLDLWRTFSSHRSQTPHSMKLET